MSLLRAYLALFSLIFIEILMLTGEYMEVIKFINENGVFFQTVVLSVGLLIAIWQLRSLIRQMKANSLQQIELNDREIKTLRFHNPRLFKPSERLTKDEEKQSLILMNLLVNHAKHIFVQYELGLLPKEVWDATDRDMRYSVNFPAFKKACFDIKDYVPVTFKKYLDTIMV